MHLLRPSKGLALFARWRLTTPSRSQHDFTRGIPPHLEEAESSSKDIRYQKRSKGRQALFVGNINPTTDYTTLRETFKAFPSFAGFRMTRHPTNPVGFVQFHKMEAAIIAYQRLKANPLSIEGRQLDIGYAKPRLPHPLDTKAEVEEEAKSPTKLEEYSPSPSICVRFQKLGSRKPFQALRGEVSKLDGFKAMRTGGFVRSAAFIDFDSVQQAEDAIAYLKSKTELGKLVVSFASVKIERGVSRDLFIRMAEDMSTVEAERTLSDVGTKHVGKVEQLPGADNGRFVIKFESETEATSALKKLQPLKEDGRLRELSYHHPQQLDRPPSNTLFIQNLLQSTRYTDLISLFSTYPGYRKVILAKAPGFQDHHNHAGWALIEFDSTSDAKAARLATHNKKYNNAILDVSFKATLTTPRDPTTSNALFCEGIFEATPQEFNAVFEGYQGFRSARLFPDGQDGYMPYGKVLFTTPESATRALEDLRVKGPKIGHGALPMQIDFLRLRSGKRHWKWIKEIRT